VPRLANVLAFANQSMRVVRGAFLISTLYNVVGISIAASGRLSPVVCAILMPLSSATVVAFACGVTAWLGRRAFPPHPAFSSDGGGNSPSQGSSFEPQNHGEPPAHEPPHPSLSPSGGEGGRWPGEGAILGFKGARRAESSENSLPALSPAQSGGEGGRWPGEEEVHEKGARLVHRSLGEDGSAGEGKNGVHARDDSETILNRNFASEAKP
jgi:hypothetical protein